MIPARWLWWLADRRRCDVKSAPSSPHADPGLLPPPDRLGITFPSFRPTIGEPDTPTWQELCAAPVQEALISLGVPGYLRPQEALKLYEISYHAAGDVLEIGSARGLSTMILARAKQDAQRPGRIVSVEILPDHHRATHETLERHGLRDRVALLLGDAAEVLPWLVQRRRRFAFAFVDHDHGLAATQHAVDALGRLLVPGGLALFHDVNDARNETGEYGIYPALVSAITDGTFRMVDLCGSAALIERRGMT
jgi:SAM-dependent methyltransferase